jgi:glycosidase
MVNEDFGKWKMGVGWLLTTRGIPMLYYGTEILMTGYTDPDAKVRADFPGGWRTDTTDKFTSAGRTTKENEAYNYIKKLASYRKKSKAIRNGKLMQFVPIDGVYVYFRYNDSETIMVVMNTSDKDVTLDTERFEERLGNSSVAKNVMTDQEIRLDQLQAVSNSISVLQMLD